MPQRRPIIGITVDYTDEKPHYALPYSYCEAVEKAGGVPIMFPYRSDLALVPQYVDLVDGMLFSGGNDLDPAAWGEERHAKAGGVPIMFPYRSDLALVPQYVDLVDGMLFSGGNDLDPAAWGEERHAKAVAIDPLRERFERALIAEVERRRIPTLGICLGSQLMNVHRGGTLHQFIPDVHGTDIEHRRLGGHWDDRHAVNLEPDAALAKAIGKTQVRANTSHKQAIREPGRGLRVIATAPDGVIEGVEDPTLPLWVGVQWHPERQHDEPEQMAIFKLLVERAAAAAAAR